MQTEPAGAEAVQQTLAAVVERLLLLHRVVEHLVKAGAGGVVRVFKNARLLNTCTAQLLLTYLETGQTCPFYFICLGAPFVARMAVGLAIFARARG